MEVQRLADGVHNGHPGVQRGVGILEDHLHPLPEGQQLLALQMADVRSVKEDLACGGLIKTGDGTAQGALSAAGLAYQAECLMPVNVQVDLVYRLDHLLFAAKQAVGFVKIFAYAFQLQQLIGRHGSFPPFAVHRPERWVPPDP